MQRLKVADSSKIVPGVGSIIFSIRLFSPSGNLFILSLYFCLNNLDC